MDVSENIPTSGSINEEDVIIIYHNQNYTSSYYEYECGKSFLDVCREMGLDKSETEISF